MGQGKKAKEECGFSWWLDSGCSHLKLWNIKCISEWVPPWRKGLSFCSSVPLRHWLSAVGMVEGGQCIFSQVRQFQLSWGQFTREGGQLWALNNQHSQHVGDEWLGLVKRIWVGYSTYILQSTLCIIHICCFLFVCFYIKLTLFRHSFSRILFGYNFWEHLQKKGRLHTIVPSAVVGSKAIIDTNSFYFMGACTAKKEINTI